MLRGFVRPTFSLHSSHAEMGFYAATITSRIMAAFGPKPRLFSGQAYSRLKLAPDAEIGSNGTFESGALIFCSIGQQTSTTLPFFFNSLWSTSTPNPGRLKTKERSTTPPGPKVISSGVISCSSRNRPNEPSNAVRSGAIVAKFRPAAVKRAVSPTWQPSWQVIPAF